ncbi:unnamed protein product [Vitrella brassicaformis CCMP3155]|uniref:Protein kinase domain-containing protein n=2 Tax=Vitrella brassicaformis TaxID=1169539 RepID=A0A0G4FCL9_VITBC|nr:unnamed protein product [Vitrella brassicaformis CCMP3155]|eukprot:CEM10971.1 unnamed protein product [Vitrella brassicaformis CCMP3155]
MGNAPMGLQGRAPQGRQGHVGGSGAQNSIAAIANPTDGPHTQTYHGQNRKKSQQKVHVALPVPFSQELFGLPRLEYGPCYPGPSIPPQIYQQYHGPPSHMVMAPHMIMAPHRPHRHGPPPLPPHTHIDEGPHMANLVPPHLMPPHMLPQNPRPPPHGPPPPPPHSHIDDEPPRPAEEEQPLLFSEVSGEDGEVDSFRGEGDYPHDPTAYPVMPSRWPYDEITRFYFVKYPYVELGRGTYGCAVKAWSKQTGEPVAIKVAFREHHHIRSQIDNEISIMTVLQPYPDYFVQMISAHHTRDFTYIIMEYCEYDLPRWTWEVASGMTPIPVVALWTRHTVKALDILATLGIQHRDLKPANYLLKPMTLNLPPHGTRTRVGSIDCSDPQLDAGLPHRPSSDMFSAGLTSSFMLINLLVLGGAPYKRADERGVPDDSYDDEHIEKVREEVCNPDWPKGKLWQKLEVAHKFGHKAPYTELHKLLDFQSTMLALDPDKRLTAQEISDPITFHPLVVWAREVADRLLFGTSPRDLSYFRLIEAAYNSQTKEYQSVTSTRREKLPPPAALPQTPAPAPPVKSPPPSPTRLIKKPNAGSSVKPRFDSPGGSEGFMDRNKGTQVSVEAYRPFDDLDATLHHCSTALGVAGRFRRVACPNRGVHTAELGCLYEFDDTAFVRIRMSESGLEVLSISEPISHWGGLREFLASVGIETPPPMVPLNTQKGQTTTQPGATSSSNTGGPWVWKDLVPPP